ncbi:MAG: TraM recognition domain-containing protein [Peptococcaceae bacterium]|nr:TraM recognition domain-containing protein [Peptococcaceae bacterium]
MVGYIIKNTTPPENLDLEFCIDVKHKRPVILEGVYRYRNTLVVGPPGSGKTVTLKSHIFQDLNRIKDSLRAGRPMGLTVLEPKGDLVDEVAARCQELGIPFHYINPLSPFTAHFNPMMGPADICAESTRTVLKNIFGKQEAFFSINQELAARNTILLLKRLKGDDLDMLDVLKCLRDYEEMDRTVTGVETKCGEDDLTEFFRKELMGKNRDKYREFIIGLRVQLEDLCGSDLLRKILLGKNSIDLDKHLSEGGVLLVNTAMGRLGKLGDTLGKFFSMHLMNAVFRRPGTESDRPPHFLYVDEFPRYMNEGFEVLLNISRSYCCATTLAIQGFSQMEFSMNEAFRKVVLNSCQNKIFFGGMDHADAKLAEAEMGFRMTEVKEPTYDYRPLIPRIFPQRYSVREKKEPRYEYTQLMELPPHTFVYRIVQFGNLQEPSIGKSRYIKSETVFNPKPDTVPLTAGEPGRFF